MHIKYVENVLRTHNSQFCLFVYVSLVTLDASKDKADKDI